MQFFLSGKWQDRDETIDVINPFDNSVIDTVPKANAADVDAALTTLEQGAKTMRAMPAYNRYQILRRTAALMLERSDDLATTISREEGKILAEAKVEAVRAADIIELSAEEARRLEGEVLPLDAAPGSGNRLGFTLRIPCGIVAGISPFNFPLHLVCHKIGPSIAAGNATLLKPATDTPLVALKLVEILLEAGLPEAAVACLTGPGGELGKAICGDDRVRKITFTGSYEVGNAICETAGMKKVTMELGSNSPVIIMDDADLSKAAAAVAAAGYSNAGQVCISTQRVLTSRKVRGDFLDALKPEVEKLQTGDQLKESTRIGPLVRQKDAERVETVIREAVTAGASLVMGGERDGAVVQPAILDNVTPEMGISREELFGPAVGLTYFDDIDDAIRLANDTEFGLSAGIFTQDVDRAMRFAKEVDAGNLHINWSSQWRADLMPYGGLKHSGMGKEGPKYAVREMTEEKMVVVHVS